MELSCPKKNLKFLTPKNLIKLRRNWMLDQPLDFTGCSSIQFFNSPPFSEHSQLHHTWYPQKIHFQDYPFKS